MSVLDFFKKINESSKEKARLAREEKENEITETNLKKAQKSIQPLVYADKVFLAFNGEPIIEIGEGEDVVATVCRAQMNLANYRILKEVR